MAIEIAMEIIQEKQKETDYKMKNAAGVKNKKEA